jgi:hypothetical protein
MNVFLISLAAALALFATLASAADDVLVLTPDNAKEHGYWVRCAVKDESADRRANAEGQSRASEPVSVVIRLGLLQGGRLHKGPFAVIREDLEIIRSISLVAHNEEGVLFSVPLRTEVDPGNYIHLLAEFSAQRETVSKMQVDFTEVGVSGPRKVSIDLGSFVDRP